jgi:dihydroorotase
MHAHLRQGAMLVYVARIMAQHFGRVMAMGNTVPAIRTAADVIRYREEIAAAVSSCQYADLRLEPLISLKMYEDTTRTQIREAFKAGAIALKLYPKGLTTNSEDGISLTGYKRLYPVLGTAEKIGMVVQIHGEYPDPDLICYDREKRFIPVIDDIVKTFPGLKVIFEHITSAGAVRWVKRQGPNVAATITVHHLQLWFNDVVGRFGSPFIRPHNYCAPIAKKLSDRAALRKAATSGNPKFILGTDSAPHPIDKKECCEGCAGVFSAPVAMSVLAQVFEEEKALTRLEDFTSRFGAEFYGLPLNEGSLTLVKEPWLVRGMYGPGPTEPGKPVVPYRMGETLSWQVKNEKS